MKNGTADVGGLWRYKDDPKFPSVYRSTHIDSDRDTNSFGDYPWCAILPTSCSLLAHVCFFFAYTSLTSSSHFASRFARRDPEKPLLIHNTELVRYLRENLEKFNLTDKIKLNSRVTLVTPVGDHLDSGMY